MIQYFVLVLLLGAMGSVAYSWQTEEVDWLVIAVALMTAAMVLVVLGLGARGLL